MESPDAVRYIISEPEIGEHAFLVVMWTGVAVSGFFLLARLIMRFRINRQKRVDDILVLTAWIISLGNACLWSQYHEHMYFVIELSKSPISDPPPNMEWVQINMKTQLAGFILVYTSLWSIKLSFLFFFRRLGDRYRLQQIIWWFVFVLLVVSYFGCVATLDYKCEMSKPETLIENCTSDSSIRHARITITVATTLDILTDAAIIILSGNVLWRVKINWSRKLALVGISLLTAFIVTMALIRMLVGISRAGIPHPAWLIAWSEIEICVAIMVACLASFWTLYTMSKNSESFLLPAFDSNIDSSDSMSMPNLLNSHASANTNRKGSTPNQDYVYILGEDSRVTGPKRNSQHCIQEV